MDNDVVVEHLMEIKTAVATLASKLDSHLEEGKCIKSEVEELKALSNKGKGLLVAVSLINVLIGVYFGIKAFLGV